MNIDEPWTSATTRRCCGPVHPDFSAELPIAERAPDDKLSAVHAHSLRWTNHVLPHRRSMQGPGLKTAALEIFEWTYILSIYQWSINSYCRPYWSAVLLRGRCFSKPLEVVERNAFFLVVHNVSTFWIAMAHGLHLIRLANQHHGHLDAPSAVLRTLWPSNQSSIAALALTWINDSTLWNVNKFCDMYWQKTCWPWTSLWTLVENPLYSKPVSKPEAGHQSLWQRGATHPSACVAAQSAAGSDPKSRRGPQHRTWQNWGL